jgi:NAD+ synthase (glutamine-hydrolysing)
MQVIIAEKPSVAREIAAIVGATNRKDGFIEGNGYAVTWAFGHLVGLAMPQQYGIAGFRRENLPILPSSFILLPRQVREGKEYKADPGVVKQLGILRELFGMAERIIVEIPLPENPANVTLDREFNSHPFVPQTPEEMDESGREIINIQTMGLAQRLQHTDCKKVVIGVSGGLDSTLALLIAVRTFDRLGLDRKGIIGVTMPGFGTSNRTYRNSIALMRCLGITSREISIRKACEQHFADIGLNPEEQSSAYENAQARERTQILMDIANMEHGMVLGTGDLSELALGWATYNGDQMSMYGLNASLPKTLIQVLLRWMAQVCQDDAIREILLDVVATPISPELLPSGEEGGIAQHTEKLVGPYELHDFFLYHFIQNGYSPAKILFAAETAFDGRYDRATILRWMRVFFQRFFSQQFKRSAMPDGPKVGIISLSPRGDWRMPSDATATLWLREIDLLIQEK